jgi:hypothetical protein
MRRAASKYNFLLNQRNYSYFISVIMFIVGLITILLCLTRRRVVNDGLFLIGIDYQTSAYINFLSGFMMMFLSVQLIWQRQLAWKITEIFLAVLMFISISRHRIISNIFISFYSPAN